MSSNTPQETKDDDHQESTTHPQPYPQPSVEEHETGTISDSGIPHRIYNNGRERAPHESHLLYRHAPPPPHHHIPSIGPGGSVIPERDRYHPRSNTSTTPDVTPRPITHTAVEESHLRLYASTSWGPTHTTHTQTPPGSSFPYAYDAQNTVVSHVSGSPTTGTMGSIDPSNPYMAQTARNVRKGPNPLRHPQQRPTFGKYRASKHVKPAMTSVRVPSGAALQLRDSSIKRSGAGKTDDTFPQWTYESAPRAHPSRIGRKGKKEDRERMLKARRRERREQRRLERMHAGVPTLSATETEDDEALLRRIARRRDSRSEDTLERDKSSRSRRSRSRRSLSTTESEDSSEDDDYPTGRMAAYCTCAVIPTMELFMELKKPSSRICPSTVRAAGGAPLKWHHAMYTDVIHSHGTPGDVFKGNTKLNESQDQKFRKAGSVGLSESTSPTLETDTQTWFQQQFADDSGIPPVCATYSTMNGHNIYSNAQTTNNDTPDGSIKQPLLASYDALNHGMDNIQENMTTDHQENGQNQNSRSMQEAIAFHPEFSSKRTGAINSSQADQLDREHGLYATSRNETDRYRKADKRETENFTREDSNTFNAASRNQETRLPWQRGPSENTDKQWSPAQSDDLEADDNQNVHNTETGLARNPLSDVPPSPVESNDGSPQDVPELQLVPSASIASTSTSNAALNPSSRSNYDYLTSTTATPIVHATAVIHEMAEYIDPKQPSKAVQFDLSADKYSYDQYHPGAQYVYSETGDKLSTRPKSAEEEGRYDQVDIFYFSYGVVVFWGLSEAEERAFLERMQSFQQQPVKMVEYDDMSFTYGRKSAIANDEVTLRSIEHLEKLSISYAFAQSVKLSICEQRVNDTIEETKDIPVELARTGKIKLTSLDISRKIGELFIERNSVNLTSDILDTPEFLWESDEWEPIYELVQSYLDISTRVDVLNQRLDIIRELYVLRLYKHSGIFI